MNTTQGNPATKGTHDISRVVAGFLFNTIFVLKLKGGLKMEQKILSKLKLGLPLTDAEFAFYRLFMEAYL